MAPSSTHKSEPPRNPGRFRLPTTWMWGKARAEMTASSSTTVTRTTWPSAGPEPMSASPTAARSRRTRRVSPEQSHVGPGVGARGVTGRATASGRVGEEGVELALAPERPRVPAAAARGARRGCPRSRTRPASRTRISSIALEPGEAVGDEQEGAPRRATRRRSRRKASPAGDVEVLAGLVEDEHGRVRARSTRARARRWRSPPDMRAPCSPTIVRRPSGRRSTQARRPAPLERLAQLGLGRLGAGRSAGSPRSRCRRRGRAAP
ncbi:MAG: hypothetical protein KatS3mg014_1981 [Actinomycetota bacterium]|nr:MAG: hypothetical protein KatS3mg014_1981 [Actinomycetota bacterium]